MAEKREYTLVGHEKPYRFDEDGLHVTRGCAWSAPGCHIGCGVLLYTDDEGRLVKVEGDPENPFNQGRLCVRCLDLPEVVYSPDRILHPMKRAREDRGKDKWELIGWDEALDEIAGKILAAKEEYGPESVAFYSGTGRDIGQYITRLCWGFNSPNFVFLMSGQSCYSPRVAGCFSTSGSFWVGDYSQQFPDRYANPEWKRPDLIVIWGNNPVVSNSDGLYGHWVVDCLKMGSRAIVVDPQMIWLASKADHYLQIRPGTDGALALGIVNYLIENDLYDHEFVSLWCYGFDELAERAREYPLGEVAGITGIPEEDIVAAARAIAESDAVTLQWGVAIDQVKETIPTAQAVLAIFEITGNIGKPGTMQQPASLLNYAAGWGSEFLTPEQEAKRIGQAEHPLIKMGFQECVTDDYIRCLETGKPYPIKVAWMQTTNPLACTGVDAKRTLEAHMNIETIVYVDLFMTPTSMALADYFLPACTYAERNGLRVGDGAQPIRISIRPSSLWASRAPTCRSASTSASASRPRRGRGTPWRTCSRTSWRKRATPSRRCRNLRRGIRPSRTACTRRAFCAPTATWDSTRPPGASSCGARCTTTWGSIRCPPTRNPFPARFPPPSCARSTRWCSPRARVCGACSTPNTARSRACARCTPNRSCT